jgi:hypothetical protein
MVIFNVPSSLQLSHFRVQIYYRTFAVLTQIAANRIVIGVVAVFHLFCVPVCVLQIFFL